jgi:hypothetical protein
MALIFLAIAMLLLLPYPKTMPQTLFEITFVDASILPLILSVALW